MRGCAVVKYRLIHLSIYICYIIYITETLLHWKTPGIFALSTVLRSCKAASDTGWVRPCLCPPIQKLFLKSLGHLLHFTEKCQTSGYLRINTGSDSFPPGPSSLIKSISWEYKSVLFPHLSHPPWPRHGAAASVQHLEQGPLTGLDNEVFQPPQDKADDRAFAEGVLHLLGNFQDDLMQLLLAGEQKMTILPLFLQ